MALYACIENESVAEVFETDGDIKEMFPESFIWVDVTEEKNSPNMVGVIQKVSSLNQL